MTIRFQCSCGKQLQAADTSAGKKVRCPACQSILTVPDDLVEAEVVSRPPAPEPPVLAPADDASVEGEGEARQPCPMCGEMILASAVKCRFCGEVLDPALRKAEAKKKGKGNYDDDMTTGDWVVAILCSGIGCIVGIVWLIQGKPKAGKMIGVSIAAAVFWNIVKAVVQVAVEQR